VERLNKINTAIKVTGSRFFLCTILGRAIRQGHSAPVPGKEILPVVDDILRGAIASHRFPASDRAFLLDFSEDFTPKTMEALVSLTTTVEIDPDRQVSHTDWTEHTVRIAFEAEDWLSRIKDDVVLRSSFQYVPFDFVAQPDSHSRLLDQRQKRVVYHPIDGPQTVSTSFRLIKESNSQSVVSIDCYCHRQWMQAIEFSF
jgi:hypothetical protein